MNSRLFFAFALVSIAALSPIHGMEKPKQEPKSSASQPVSPREGSANRGLRRSNPTSPVVEEAKPNRGPNMRYTDRPTPQLRYVEEH